MGLENGEIVLLSVVFVNIFKFNHLGNLIRYHNMQRYPKKINCFFYFKLDVLSKSYEYVEEHPYGHVKCHPDFELDSNRIDQPELSCTNMCNIQDECKFYFYTEREECQMFKRCDYYWDEDVKHHGITYRKIGQYFVI